MSRSLLPAWHIGPRGIMNTQFKKTMEEIGADRKSTRLNSSHLVISYAVFCLKKNKFTQSSIHNTSLKFTSSAENTGSDWFLTNVSLSIATEQTPPRGHTCAVFFGISITLLA